MPDYDAAVIGSGPNGLSAAVALARTGRKVIVLEARSTPGGGMRTAKLTLPGFHHDVCSAIHPMAAASPYWRTLPLEEHGLRWVQPEIAFAHPFDDAPAAICYPDLEQTAATLGDDGDAWRALFGPLVERFDDLVHDGLAPLRPPKSPLLLARFGLQALRSARALARGWLQSQAGRALFAGAAAHSVLPLEQAGSAAIGLMLTAAAHGVGWPLPAGGSLRIAEALVSLLEEHGGEVRCDHPVTSLDEVPTAGPVLFDTSPRSMAEICGDALPASYRRRLEGFAYGPGACKVDWALSGPIPWADERVARAGTVHLGGTLDELCDAERAPHRGEVAASPYVLLAQQSAFDARAPAGQHTGWAYCHVPNGSQHDATAAIERQVERFAPGFRGRILARHTTTAAALEAYNPNYIGGDVNGGRADLGQLFARPVARLKPHTTPHPRIFLCSASTPPGGGVHGMGGYWAARAAAPEVAATR